MYIAPIFKFATNERRRFACKILSIRICKYAFLAIFCHFWANIVVAGSKAALLVGWLVVVARAALTLKRLPTF